jgi:hypothetical protein
VQRKLGGVDNTTATTVLYNLVKPDIRVDDDALGSKNKVVINTRLQVLIILHSTGEGEYVRIPSSRGAPYLSSCL